MQLATIRKVLWRFGPRLSDGAVLQDADELVRVWGDGAYTVAATLSWREDTGLVHAARVGHWARVQQEIGRRRGWRDDEAEAEFAAGIDRVRSDS